MAGPPINTRGHIRRQGFTWSLRREWRSLYLHLFGEDGPVSPGEQRKEMQRLMLVGFLYEHGMIDDPNLPVPLRRATRVSSEELSSQAPVPVETEPRPRRTAPKRSRQEREEPRLNEAPAERHEDAEIMPEAAKSETKCLTPDSKPVEPEAPILEAVTESASISPGNTSDYIGTSDNNKPSTEQIEEISPEISEPSSTSSEDNDRKEEEKPILSTNTTKTPQINEGLSNDPPPQQPQAKREVGFLKGFSG